MRLRDRSLQLRRDIKLLFVFLVVTGDLNDYRLPGKVCCLAKNFATFFRCPDRENPSD